LAELICAGSKPDADDMGAIDDCMLNQTIGYFRWIDADDKIVGMDAFHLSTCAYGRLDARRFSPI
jgi:hypothetical protein